MTDNSTKKTNNLISMHLTRLALDLQSSLFVKYVHIFKIQKNENVPDIFFFVSILMNSFVCPAVPKPDQSFSYVNKYGSFFLNTPYNNLGLYSLLVLETSSYYYFLLFRTTYGNINDEYDPFYDVKSWIVTHDRFFSFELFCKVNGFKILPWNCIDRKSRTFFVSNYNSTTPMSQVCLTFSDLITKNIKKPILSSIFFIASDWYDFNIYSHSSLVFFLNFSFPFYVVKDYKFKDAMLVWNFSLLTLCYSKYSSLSIQKQTGIFGSDNLSSLLVKSYDKFKVYCKASTTEIKLPVFFFCNYKIPIFNFTWWFYYLQKFGWFSVCGFFPIHATEYANQIYDFMQYRVLNSNIHYIYSHFRDGKLYFWCVFESRVDYFKFKKKNKDLGLVFVVKEEYEKNLHFKATVKFLRKYTYYRPLNCDKMFNVFGNYDFCDYRLASHYVGVYSSKFEVSEVMNQQLFKNGEKAFGVFYKTKTKYEDTLYSLSVLHSDVRFGVIYTTRLQSGLWINDKIWFFCKPFIPQDFLCVEENVLLT